MARHGQAQDPKHHQHHRPAKRPELNSVNNIWHPMRDRALWPQVFTAYTTTVSHRFKAAKTLINQPSRFISISMHQSADEPCLTGFG
jgi:hypothetical protein